MTSPSNTPERPVHAENDPPTGITWDVVHDEERAALSASLGATPGKSIAGLAFSGGGIRSATFCLGVIQGMAKARRLSRFDYLSTVSGGGYIGSWLSALICRRAGRDVRQFEKMIAPDPINAAQPRPFAAVNIDASVEHPSLQWLRMYSNYLTPRVGMFGVDTWTAIITYLRNLTLNLLVLAPLLIAGILAALCVFPIAHRLHNNGAAASLVAALGALVCVAGAIGWCIDQPRLTVTGNALRSTPFVFFSAGLGTLLTAWLIAVGLGVPTASTDYTLWQWAVAAGFANMLVWSIAAAIRQVMRGDAAPSPKAAPDFDHGRNMLDRPDQWFFPMFLSGALAGTLFKLWANARFEWLSWHAPKSLAPVAFDTVIGTPVVLVIMSHAILLFIGLSKRRMSEADREWLGRLGAILALLGMAWIAVYAMLWLGAVAAPLQEAATKWFAAAGRA